MKFKCVYNSNNKDFTVGQVYKGMPIRAHHFRDGACRVTIHVTDDKGEIQSVFLNGENLKFVVVGEEEVVEETKLLTGLEAIELMKQGKIVEDKVGNKYRIIDGIVCFKAYHNNGSEYAKEYAFDFTIDYKEYIEPKPLTGWEKLKDNEEHYYVILSSCARKESVYFGGAYNTLYDQANAFSTQEKADEINFKQTLFRKLQRFSDENGGLDIDWTNSDKGKYFICYDHTAKKLKAYLDFYLQDCGKVYFVSEEVAKKAIELFHDDLIKYLTK